MNLEFLKTHPFTTKVVKNWFHQTMIDSFKDPNIAEEFKQFVLENQIELEKLALLIDNNPRMLFDVFDENDVIVSVGYHENFGFNYAVGDDNDQQHYFKTRKEAEHAAIEVAFQILEEQLTPAVEEIEVTGEEIVED